MDGAMMTDISTKDAAFLDRLFGAQIPAEMMDDMFQVAKAVEPASLRPMDVDVAISVLVQSIVHQGVGGGICAGWSLQRLGGRVAITVCRFKPAAAKAA